MTRVEQLWSDISAQSDKAGLFQLVDDAHPLKLYAGIDYRGNRVLMLVGPNAPASLPPSGIVEVTCAQRTDKMFAIIVHLARDEFKELFGRLCQDLVDATRDSAPENGGEALLQRLNRWRKLLEVQSGATLSEISLRGLIGELWFLQSVAIPLAGVEAAISGWTGPLDSPQDFVLGDMVVEIKTCMSGTQRVTISSLQQLDAEANRLYLSVIWLSPSHSAGQGSFTVAQLVASLREAATVSSTAGTEFDLRLAEAGYSDREEYEHAWYRVISIRHFHVRDGFPRLTRAHVPVGVIDANYTVDLTTCSAYESHFE